MTAASSWLDHVGLIVRDLREAHDVMAALGFDLTARAEHTMTTADGRVVPAGSAQHAIMLAHGYIELMQITDPTAGHQLAAAPQTRFGLHILALGCADAPASHARFTAQGLPVGPIRRWARQVQEPDRQGLARFVYFDTPWTPQDPSYLCWVQHLTPELMRASRAPVHPNGAVAVRGIRYAGPPAQAAAWQDRLQRLEIGSPAAPGSGGLDLGATRLTMAGDASRTGLAPDLLEIGTSAVGLVAERARRLGLATDLLADGGVLLDLQGTLGIRLQFTPQTAAG